MSLLHAQRQTHFFMRSDMGKITVRKEDVGLWRRMLTRAQEGNLTNHNFFLIHVVEGYLHSSMFCTLGLPPLFMDHYRKRLRERITLEGADGHKWLTMLGLQLDSQQYCLNIGWKEFAADHNLAINDQIVFLLFEDSHFLVQVFDANSNFKGRVVASPERGGDGRVNAVSQAGMQQRKEASLAEKTRTKAKLDVQVQEQRRGTNNPLLYCDPEMENLGIDKTPREVDANPALRADLPSVLRSKANDKDVIELPDSSEDEDGHMPVIRVASGIKMRTKQTVSRCSIKVPRVDAEGRRQSTQEDVSDCIKRPTPRQSNRLAEMAEQNNPTQKHVQSDEDQNGGAANLGNGSLRNVMPGQNPGSRSPPSSISAPSSPEHVPALKRSRKLQRKIVDYEDDEDYLGPSSIRVDTLLKPGKAGENVGVPGAECYPVEARPKRISKANKLAEMMAEEATKRQPKRIHQLQQASSKITEAAKIRSQDNKKKKGQENLPKGMKRTPASPLGQSYTEVLNATQRVADDVADRDAEAIPQENGGSKVIQSAPPQMLGGVGGRSPVISRPKVKVHKKREKPCPPPEESRPQPEEAPKVVFKRPTKMARLGPAKVHKIMYISKRRPVTDQERKDTLVKAQEYAQKSINKHYVMQLRVSQVYCGYHLGVLPAFVEAMQLPLVKETMTFFDVTGKTWEVDWQGDHPLKPGFNSKGWTKFVLDHYLEEGDVCVFELPDPNAFNISVTIFPIVPLGEMPELGWKSHYGGEHENSGEKSELAAQSPVKSQNGFAVPQSPAKSQNGFAVHRSPAEIQNEIAAAHSPVNTLNGFAVPRSPAEIQNEIAAAHSPVYTQNGFAVPRSRVEIQNGSSVVPQSPVEIQNGFVVPQSPMNTTLAAAHSPVETQNGLAAAQSSQS